MEKINFSVVVTTFNEDKSIIGLIDSLINQSLKPNELVIVDAGSTDATISKIHAYKSSGFPIHLLSYPGVNRSHGRNIGIDTAKNEHIAIIDAGCEAHRDWLEELSKGFEGEHAVVAGFYLPVTHTSLHRLFARFVATSLSEVNDLTYLPSSRSLAFTKSCWLRAGKYPEYLDTCEDLVFAVNLKKVGNMVVNRNAIVWWKQADRFGEFFTQIRGYARGDIQAFYTPHVLKILTVWLRYFIILFIPALIFVYILFPVVKFNREIHHIRDMRDIIFTQLVSDMAVIAGSFEGVLKRLRFIK